MVRLFSRAWARKPFAPVSAGVIRTHLYAEICQGLVCCVAFFFFFFPSGAI